MTLKRSGSRLLTAAALLLFTLGVLGTLALTALASCRHDSGSLEQPRDDVFFTLTGSSDGRVYTAELYPYKSGGITGLSSWADATDKINLAASGTAIAEEGFAKIRLARPSGSGSTVFNDNGLFLAVVTEASGRPAIRYTDVFFKNGDTVVNWDMMMLSPEGPADGGVLHLDGTSGGSRYIAGLYGYSGGIIEDYTAWTAVLASLKAAAGFARTSEGAVTANIPLTDAGGLAFTGSGTYLAVVTEVSPLNRVTVRYWAAAFDTGIGSLTWDGMTDAPFNPSDGDKGILTISGSDAGRYYSAEVYSYSGEKSQLTDSEYIGWTALGAQLAAGARAFAPNAVRLVSMQGNAFSTAGTYLVVVNEYLDGTASATPRGTRYQTAVAFDANGSALVSWTAMALSPSLYEGWDEAGVLTVKGAEIGKAYMAEVFNYSEGGKLDYATYVKLAGSRVAAGAGAAPLIKLTGGLDADFNAAGRYLVILNELAEDGTVGKAYYKTAVEFDNGAAVIDMAAMLRALLLVSFDAKGGSPVPDAQRVFPNSFARRPSDPVIAASYDFLGWVTESGVPFNFETDAVTDDLDLYAYWGDEIRTVAGAAAYLASKSANTAADPILLKMNIPLTDSANGWNALVSALENANKYVALDLSACAMTGEFDAGIGAGKAYAVSLVLPNGAASIKADTGANWTNLKTVRGPNITDIGARAFSGCMALTELYIPGITHIGRECFSNTGTAAPLTITMGANNPAVGGSLFAGVEGANSTDVKTVTIKVPSASVPHDSTGEYDNYGFDFRLAFSGWGNDGTGGGAFCPYLALDIVSW